jgi:hypothetical protein
MTNAETIIIILLAIIAYFLYQIGRQLTFLTGKRMRMPFSNMFTKQTFRPKQKIDKEEKEEKLPN